MSALDDIRACLDTIAALGPAPTGIVASPEAWEWMRGRLPATSSGATFPALGITVHVLPYVERGSVWVQYSDGTWRRVM